MALQKIVAEDRRIFPPIHGGLAFCVLLGVVLNLVAITYVLLLTEPPPKQVDVSFHELTPKDDAAARLSQCTTARDVTPYPMQGLKVSGLPGVGTIFARKMLHENDIVKRLHGMLCINPTSSDVTTAAFSLLGFEGGHQDQANVCLTPDQSERQRERLDRHSLHTRVQHADLYVESEQKLDGICQHLRKDFEATYREQLRPASDEAELLGITCNAMPLAKFIAVDVQQIQIHFYFGWQAKKQKGIARFHVTLPCFSAEEAERFRLQVASSYQGHSDPYDALSPGGEGLYFPPKTRLFRSLSGYFSVDTAVMDHPVAKQFGYAAPGHEDYDTFVENVSLAYNTLCRYGVSSHAHLSYLEQKCKNLTLPLRPAVDLYKKLYSWEDAFGAYKNMLFTYECREVIEPSILGRFSYIWPALSITYSLLMVYAAKGLYTIATTIGRKCGLLHRHKFSNHSPVHAEMRAEFESMLQDRDQIFEDKLKWRDETISSLRKVFLQSTTATGTAAPSADVATAAAAAPSSGMGTQDAAEGLAPHQIEDLNRRLENLLSKGLQAE